MELQAKIIASLGTTEGVSKAGNSWMKSEWVAETMGQYPKKVKFHIFGADRNKNINLEVGKDYTLQFDIESREYNSRWYTDIAVFSASPLTQQMPQTPSDAWQNVGATPSDPPFGQAAPSFNEGPVFGPQPGSESDDLPF